MATAVAAHPLQSEFYLIVDSVELWLLSSDDKVTRKIYTHTSPIHTVVFDHLGNYVAIGDAEGQTVVFDAATQNVMLRLSGNSQPVSAIAIASNSQTIASADTVGDIFLWDPAIGCERGIFRVAKPIAASVLTRFTTFGGGDE
ncbi:MAG: hypothetical protein R3C99_02285 [Pirellulaceae bacterium]